mgnify:CR=1 FL=1
MYLTIKFCLLAIFIFFLFLQNDKQTNNNNVFEDIVSFSFFFGMFQYQTNPLQYIYNDNDDDHYSFKRSFHTIDMCEQNKCIFCSLTSR